jgi:hypothetical protein
MAPLIPNCNTRALDRLRSVAISLLAFIFCLIVELRSDGAAEVMTIRNCYSICLFDVVVEYSYIWSVVMDISISYGPVYFMSFLTHIVPHICNRVLVYY